MLVNAIEKIEVLAFGYQFEAKVWRDRRRVDPHPQSVGSAHLQWVGLFSWEDSVSCSKSSCSRPWCFGASLGGRASVEATGSVNRPTEPLKSLVACRGCIGSWQHIVHPPSLSIRK
jgi:hypothetical protein